MMENSSFGSQIKKDLSGVELLKGEWAKLPTSFAKMVAIHKYVRSHFSWDHIYSKYAEGNIKNSWEKKTGSSGDINIILINLLKASGLPVEPLLVNERQYGKIDTTYPYMDQFNKVVAYLVIDGQSYILDGTDRETPSFEVPFSLLNTTGFIVDRKNANFVKITDNSKIAVTTVNLIGDVSTAGTMSLHATSRNYNYSKLERQSQYKQNQAKYEREFFEPYHLTTSDTFMVAGLNDNSLPIEHTITLSEYPLTKTGDYYLLNYNLFTGLTKNPFIKEKRFSDVNFGCKYQYNLQGMFTIPADLEPETLPKSLRMVMPDRSMTIIRQVEKLNNTVQVGVRVEFSKTEFNTEEYYDLQTFYKQMLELLNEPIVLKSKA